MKKAIVVGATSGIGFHIAQVLCEKGYEVAALGRREDRLKTLESAHAGKLTGFVHDATQFETVEPLFLEITKRLGGLDLLVYAAGVMPVTGWDDWDLTNDLSIIDTNVSGAVAWCNLAAQRFKGTGRGAIVGIGSVAGERGRGMQPVYGASKAFFHAYLEALRNRVSRFGVKVTTIKPGPVATEMTAHLDQSRMMGARKAAEISVAKAFSGRECYLSPVHMIAFAIIRNVPSIVFRRLKL